MKRGSPHRLTIQPLQAQAAFKAALSHAAASRAGRFALHQHPRELSTGHGLGLTQAVDDLAPAAPDWRLGVVVAKRFAPKAVTRNLVRRQAREVLRQHLQSAALTPQSSLDMVIRTRTAVAPAQQYRSASSALLKKSVAADLKALLAAAPSLPTGV